MSTAPSDDPPQRYHHGNLHAALLELAVDAVRRGGPEALSLREVTRRAGVSANAAYRHFSGLPDLQHAVAQVGLAELGRAMRDGRGRTAASSDGGATSEPPADQASEAVEQYLLLGRNYVRWALEQPGLFTATFAFLESTHSFLRGVAEGVDADDAPPAEQLGGVLRRMAAHGLLAEADIPAAATTTWAGVHGLAVLLQGPLAPAGGASVAEQVQATTAHLLSAVAGRRPPAR